MDADNEARLDELAASNVRLKKWLACVTAWLVVTWLWPLAPKSSESTSESTAARNVSASRLAIVDRDGHEAIVLEPTDEARKISLDKPWPAIVIAAGPQAASIDLRHGINIAGLSTHNDEGPVVFAKRLDSRAALGVNKTTAAVSVEEKKKIGMMAVGPAITTVGLKNDESYVGISNQQGTPGISLFDSRGQQRASLGIVRENTDTVGFPGFPALTLLDEREKVVWKADQKSAEATGTDTT
jgi:hypothetical protein